MVSLSSVCCLHVQACCVQQSIAPYSRPFHPHPIPHSVPGIQALATSQGCPHLTLIEFSGIAQPAQCTTQLECLLQDFGWTVSEDWSSLTRPCARSAESFFGGCGHIARHAQRLCNEALVPTAASSVGSPPGT